MARPYPKPNDKKKLKFAFYSLGPKTFLPPQYAKDIHPEFASALWPPPKVSWH